jgi:hypothetical protein
MCKSYDEIKIKAYHEIQQIIHKHKFENYGCKEYIIMYVANNENVKKILDVTNINFNNIEEYNNFEHKCFDIIYNMQCCDDIIKYDISKIIKEQTFNDKIILHHIKIPTQ